MCVVPSPHPRCVSCVAAVDPSCCEPSPSCCWSPTWPTCGPRLRPSAGCSCRRWAAATRPPDALTSTPTWTSPDTSDWEDMWQLSLSLHYTSSQCEKKMAGGTYTVFLSWRISLEENSLRTSRKARLIGGNSGPRGFWYLNANSIPSLMHS